MRGLLKSKNEIRNVLALDIGTGSVSAAVAELENGKKPRVLGVFRYHYDALAENKSRVLINSISKAFIHAHKLKKNISSIRIGFSSPFFAEQSIKVESNRKNAHLPVTADEVNSVILSAKTQLPKNLEAVSCDVESSKIDGYEVSDPYEYSGEVLTIEAKIFSISKFLKNKFDELKENFFPQSDISYISDENALSMLAQTLFPKKKPAVLDIGAEVSVMNSQTLPFGVRALQRKIASFFKFGLLDAENMLRKLTYGTLDYARERAVNKIMQDSVSEFLGQINGLPVYVSGAGADFNFIKNAVPLSPLAFKERFSSLGGLEGGKDAVLTALILLNE